MSDDAAVSTRITDGAVVTPAAGADNPKSEQAQAALTEAKEREHVEKLAAARIAEIESNPALTTAEKSELVGRIRSALTSGSPSLALMGIMAVVAAERAEAADRDDVGLTAGYGVDGGYRYSPESTMFFNEKFNAAMGQSSTLRTIDSEVKAFSTEDMSAALDETRSNYAELKRMKANKELTQQQLEDIQQYKLMHSSIGAEIIRARKEGKSPEEISALMAPAIERQRGVIRQVFAEVSPHFDRDTSKYLEEHFGNPPDADKIHKRYSQFKPEALDAALLAYNKNGKDISKLPPEQQEAVHLASAMAGVDAALVMNATKSLAQSKELQRKLADPGLTREQSAELIEQHMKKLGMTPTNGVASHQFALEMADVIKKKPEALQMLADGRDREVGQLYQQEIVGDYGVKRTAGQTSPTDDEKMAAAREAVRKEDKASYSLDSINYEATALSVLSAGYANRAQDILDGDYKLPSYISQDEARRTAAMASANEWAKYATDANHQQAMLEANLTPEEQKKLASGSAQPSAAESSHVMTKAEEEAIRQDLAKTGIFNQQAYAVDANGVVTQVAAVATAAEAPPQSAASPAPSPESAPAATVAAVAAVAPPGFPPGYPPDVAEAAMAALGGASWLSGQPSVGGQATSRADEKAPPTTQQNTAAAETGARGAY